MDHEILALCAVKAAAEGWRPQPLREPAGASASPGKLRMGAAPWSPALPERRPGDWFCPRCGEDNFGRRTSCRRCHAACPALVAASPPPPHAGKGAQVKPGKPVGHKGKASKVTMQPQQQPAKPQQPQQPSQPSPQQHQRRQSPPPSHAARADAPPAAPVSRGVSAPGSSLPSAEASSPRAQANVLTPVQTAKGMLEMARCCPDAAFMLPTLQTMLDNAIAAEEKERAAKEEEERNRPRSEREVHSQWMRIRRRVHRLQEVADKSLDKLQTQEAELARLREEHDQKIQALHDAQLEREKVWQVYAGHHGLDEDMDAFMGHQEVEEDSEDEIIPAAKRRRPAPEAAAPGHPAPVALFWGKASQGKQHRRPHQLQHLQRPRQTATPRVRDPRGRQPQSWGVRP